MPDKTAETMQPGLQHKLTGIESARGIAAMMVVFYHAARHLRADVGYLAWGGLVQFGHAGVDFFFVLSGFIIMFVHGLDLGVPQRLGKYTERRFTRIYPYYWFALLVGLALQLAGHHVPDFGHLLRSASLLPLGGDVGVAWTLQHELLFYLVFALAILNRRLGIGLFVVWFTCVLAVLATGYAPHDAPVLERLLASFNIEFLFGMTAALVVRQAAVVHERAMLAIGITGFAVFACVEDLGRFNGYAASAQVAYGLSSMLIVIGLARLEMAGRLHLPAALQKVGTASYSIYLLHLPCIGVVYKLMGATGLLGRLPDLLTYAVLLCAGIGGGMLLSRLVEYPLMRLVRRLLAGAKPARVVGVSP